MRCVFALALLGALLTSRARALPPQQEPEPELMLSPYSSLVREHYYRVLSRSPTRAFLWELTLPGAGHFYNGFPIQAAVSIGLSVAGASLWVAGAVRDRPVTYWTGVGLFAGGRLYGLISAPVTALLLNAAYRRQLGITGSF
jgi:hypothetical protein